MTASALDHAPSASSCLFQVAGRMFAVDIRAAREAHTFERYTVVPLAPPNLLGMTNLRGAIIPIVDLRAPLGLPPGPPSGTVPALVVEANGVRLALAVDSVLGIEPLGEWLESTEAAAGGSGLERGRRRRGDDAVPILDIAGLLESLGCRSPKEREK